MILKYIRYFLRELLFEYSCIVCDSSLKLLENSFCEKCLYNISKISLKKNENIYYLWSLDEQSRKIFKKIGKRDLSKDLKDIIKQKIEFIYSENLIKRVENNSKLISKISLSNQNGRTLFIEDFNKNINKDKIYFCLFFIKNKEKN